MTRRVINMRQLLFAALVVRLPHKTDLSNDEEEWLSYPMNTPLTGSRCCVGSSRRTGAQGRGRTSRSSSACSASPGSRVGAQARYCEAIYILSDDSITFTIS